MSDVTLKEAVEYLSHTDENYQQFGATFIQHTTFNEERAKQEVWALLHWFTIIASTANTPSKKKACLHSAVVDVLQHI